MSRRNNVRGPTSALTEFLRESGITPTTVARRVRTREVAQPTAGPSTTEGQEVNEQNEAEEEREYASDNLDYTDTEAPPAKKKKITKAAEAKLKAQAKKAAKKSGDDDYEDSEAEDPYTAVSKMWKDGSRPSNGSFCNCATCGKQFTVTKYTMAARAGPGFLCHPCFKKTGGDPFKKPAVPKRRTAADKRNVTHFEERRIASLTSTCVKIVSKYIDDIEALGNIGSVNLDRIAKVIAKDRSLTPENAMLLYDVESTKLTLYDATNLIPPALCTLSALNPNLANLRLDYCGRINNEVMNAWSTSFKYLKRLELLGPFLVHASAWQDFFKSHRKLEGFLITQSPRFDEECALSLVKNCKNLRELRLKEIGKMCDDFLVHISTLGSQLTYLDLSYPGVPGSLSTKAVVDLMTASGENLAHLDLSGNTQLSDGFLYQGLKPNARQLHSLVLSGVTDLTDAGVAEFFDTWEAAAEGTPNPPLSSVDFSRCHQLSGLALASLLKHSGSALQSLNISGWKATPQDVLASIGKKAPRLKRLDIGWCREADDWVLKDVMEHCTRIEEVKVWGCQRISETCPRKRGVSLQGLEALSAI